MVKCIMDLMNQTSELRNISKKLSEMKCRNFLYQTWDHSTVYTYDLMPDGFMSVYYGLEEDRECPLAMGIRKNWRAWSSQEAIETNGKLPEYSAWKTFNVLDGKFILDGYMDRVSLCLYIIKTNETEPFPRDYLIELKNISCIIDQIMCKDNSLLNPIPRNSMPTRENEIMALKMVRQYPQSNFKDIARHMNVDERTLKNLLVKAAGYFQTRPVKFMPIRNE